MCWAIIDIMQTQNNTFDQNPQLLYLTALLKSKIKNQKIKRIGAPMEF